MIGIGVAAAALLAAAAGSEIGMRGMKLQTGFARLAAAWVVPYAAAAAWFVVHALSLVALTIFWVGAFLAWFGIRSHIESSIVLRMIYLLRRQPMSEGELMASYMSVCSESLRMTELSRAGLITGGPGAARVTKKGRLVLRLVSAIR